MSSSSGMLFRAQSAAISFTFCCPRPMRCVTITAPVRSVMRRPTSAGSSCRSRFNGRKRGTRPARLMHDQFDSQPKGAISTSRPGSISRSSRRSDKPIVADGRSRQRMPRYICSISVSARQHCELAPVIRNKERRPSVCATSRRSTSPISWLPIPMSAALPWRDRGPCRWESRTHTRNSDAPRTIAPPPAAGRPPPADRR